VSGPDARSEEGAITAWNRVAAVNPAAVLALLDRLAHLEAILEHNGRVYAELADLQARIRNLGKSRG
jgi:hypothetical protein